MVKKAAAIHARRGGQTRLTDKVVQPGSGSGNSSTAPSASQMSPVSISSRHKRARNVDFVDLGNESIKTKHDLPPCFLQPEFFRDSSLRVHKAESLHIGGLDRPTKRAHLARDAAAMIRILEMVVVSTEEETSLEIEVKRLREANSALEEEKRKNVEQKEVDTKRIHELVTSQAVLLGERDALNEAIVQMKASLAPSEDEPDDVKLLKTRKELVDRIIQSDEDCLAATEVAFNNAIDQLRLVNPGV